MPIENVFRYKTGITSVDSTLKGSNLKAVPASDIRKEIYRVLERYTLTGTVEQSFGLKLLGNRVNVLDGLFAGASSGTTVNITIELDVLGEFVADLCSKVNYGEEEFTMISVQGGGSFRVALKDCRPCDGDSCGEDAYDIMTVSKRSIKANLAFSKALDYALFTGKDIKTDTAISGFTSLLAGAKTLTGTDLGMNSVDDLEKTLANLQEQVEKAQFDYKTGATGTVGQADYKPGLGNNIIPRQSTDFVILASHQGVRKLRQHQDVPFSWLNVPQIISGAYETKYRGKWDGVYDLFEVPGFFIGGADFVILDLASYVGMITCSFEEYMGKGSNPEYPRTEFYYKDFEYFATRIDKAGNYTTIIPARADDKQVYLYQEPAVITA